RRHRPLVLTAGVAVFLTLLLSVGVLAFSYLHIAEALEETEQQKKAADRERTIVVGERTRADTNAKEADANAKRADRDFDKALAAVDEMLAVVGQDWLEKIPQMTVLRQRLLHKALTFYEDLLKDKSDNPVLRHRLGKIHWRIGILQRMMGKLKEARQHFDQGIAVLTKLRDEFPATAAYEQELADTYLNLGNLFEQTG